MLVVTPIPALVSFEYLISFKYEMEFLWERKWSAATLIFFSNRYLLMANIVSSVTSRTPQASNLSCFLNVSLILCRCKCSSTRKISTLKVVYQWVSCSNSRLMSTWYFLSSGQFSVLPAHGALQIRFQGIRPLTRTLIMHSVLDSTHLRTITRSLMETSSNIYIDYISSHITDLRFSTYPFSR